MPLFSPDSPLVAAVHASPKCGERRPPAASAPDMLILHYTGMEAADAACRRLCEPDSEVSSHYLVFEDGRIAQLVPESARAWHAGVASWEGASDINSRSIGIEIANPGHDYGYPDFPAAQIEAVIALCRDILARHAIRADRVLAHSDVAPSRKRDPGEKFPWAALHDNGVGHWVPQAPIVRGKVFRLGDRGDEIRALQERLGDYGYGISPTGEFGRATEDVVAAFQRHFRPALVDGAADPSTQATLRELLAARPAAGERQ
jgi:N-acetylmuramoyl-L-alanine amidase